MALQGCVDEISRSRVFGWAMNSERLRDALEIIVCVNGQEITRSFANRTRAGLSNDLGGDATGAYEFDIKLSPPLSVFRSYLIEVFVLGFEDRLPGWKRELTAPIPSGSSFTPIILTSTGRSGSTFLMGELGQHKQIVYADIYPYEIKLIAYYSAAYRTLVSLEDRINSTEPATMFDTSHRNWIGHNPYNSPGLFSIVKDRIEMEDLFEKAVPVRYAEMFKRNIEDYYNIIKKDKIKTGASCFVEKGDIDQAARDGARMLFGNVREVVLVRDPRDMLSSAKAFWKLPGPEAIEMLTTTLPRLEQIRHERNPDSLFIRYEDLVHDPTGTRSALTRFIGITDFPTSGCQDDARNALQASHGTSRNAGASIGRWQSDLTADEIGECDSLFGSYMELFGYSSSSKAPPKANELELFKGSRAVGRLEQGSVASGGSTLQPLLDILFQTGRESEAYLVSGWSAIEPEFVWSSRENSLRFNRPANPGPLRLRLVGRPLVLAARLPSQRIALSINGKPFGEVRVDNYFVLECELPWDLVAPNGDVVIDIECPDAARPCDISENDSDDRILGFALERLTLFGAAGSIPLAIEPTVARPPSASIDADNESVQFLMLEFESLGENCEFGLVQRRCNVDPLGLFRFSSAPIEKLLSGLKSKFEGMGRPGSLEIQESPNGREYMVLDKIFGFLYHAWVLVGEKTPEEVEQREIRRLPLLIRKLIDTIQFNEKIFVYHSMIPMTVDLARELNRALKIHQQTTLLWVELADEQHLPGSVEQLEPGLLKGYMDRFAPGENAHDLSLECWIEVCRNAHRIWKAA